MDIESSILPAPSPIGSATNPGADDTYLFDRAHHVQQTLENMQKVNTSGESTELKETSGAAIEFSTQTPPDSYLKSSPEPGHSSKSAEDSKIDQTGDTTSSSEPMSSSPTAAAAARTISRALSITSMGGYETANDQSRPQSSQDSDEEDAYKTPKKPVISADGFHGDSSDERSTIRYQNSFNSLNGLSADAGSTPGAALLNRRSSGRRPKFLRSRHSSQRSSISSFVTNPDGEGSEVTLGVDYALPVWRRSPGQWTL